MKIAVLVLAYEAPAVLHRHARFLEDFDFIVHVDAKTGMTNFSEVASLPNVSILAERVSIFWRGWTMVRAQIALMRAAVEARYDRLVFLSDDSFSIKPAGELRSLLEAPANRLQVRPAPELRGRYDRFFFYDCPGTSVRGFYNEDRAFVADDLRHFESMEDLMRRGKKPLEKLYYGSQWCCLTRSAAEHVLRVHDTDEHLRKSFEFSSVPDEHYIHTILRTTTDHFANRGAFIWADWTRQPKPYVFVDASELDVAMASEFLFARKIRDPALADAVSERLLSI